MKRKKIMKNNKLNKINNKIKIKKKELNQVSLNNNKIILLKKKINNNNKIKILTLHSIKEMRGQNIKRKKKKMAK
jgi:hypothetical protein